jgi:type II secretory pathway component PulK
MARRGIPCGRRGRRRRRSGAILVVTLLVIFSLASLVLVLGSSTRVELSVSSNLAASVQASAVERGAEQYVCSVLAEYGTTLDTDLTDDDFAAVPVGDGYFWVCRTDFGDDPIRLFGPVDEGSKLNVNYATYEQLMKLPNMTPEVAGSIVDWHDADETPTNGGAESSYYGTLPSPYQAKNDSYETVEELLLVQGVSRELLYGTSEAPPLGQQASSRGASGQQATDVQTARGLYDLLTVYSKERPTAAAAAAGGGDNAKDGLPAKISIRDRTQRGDLRELLVKTFGDSRGSALGGLIGTDEYTDVFTFAVRLNMTGEEFDKIADRLTTTAAPQRGQPAAPTAVPQGRINVNLAPRDVLLCLPDLDASDVDKLIAQRQSNQPGTTTLGWVLDALKEKSADLGKYITGASGGRYSADIVAVSGNGKAFRHVRIVVDASSSSSSSSSTTTTGPKIIFRRDFTDRGWPMDPQILASLRGGRGLNGVANVRGPMGSGTPGGTLR